MTHYDQYLVKGLRYDSDNLDESCRFALPRNKFYADRSEADFRELLLKAVRSQVGDATPESLEEIRGTLIETGVGPWYLVDRIPPKTGSKLEGNYVVTFFVRPGRQPVLLEDGKVLAEELDD